MSDSHKFSPEGWNTLEVRSLAAVVNFPSGVEIKVGLMSPDGEAKYREFRWPELERLGLHTPDCSYAEVKVKVPESRMSVEFASEGDSVAVRATLLDNPGGLVPFADVFMYGKLEGRVSLEGDKVIASTGNGTFSVSAPVGEPKDQLSLSDTATFAGSVEGGLLLFASTDGSAPDEGTAAAFIDEKKADALAWENRFDNPDHQAAFEGMWRSIIWNTLYASSIGRVVTVVSRDWCVDGNYGDFVLFEWDTFFSALQAAPASKELAYNNVRAVLSGATDKGFVPSIFCEWGKSLDRSMVPVGGMIVYKLYERFGEKDFIAEVFPKLLRWHNWWMTARDGNGDGLLEWGSNEFTPPNPQWQAYTLQAARYESGLDNSPMYDDAEFDAPTATMRLADVGLNAAYSMDAWALARLAEAIGDTENAKKLSDEHAAMKRRFNELLWSEEDGIYLNRYWNGDFSKRLAPTLFYTLGGRVAEPERAKRMVEEHMLNEDEFWGDHVLPAISRNDPAFGDQEYWRGRIWGPMNWLAYEGLRHYGLEQVAREMGEKNLRTFLAEWEGESHVHENYNGATGEGDDAKYSEPVYFWGGLLALIGLIESGALKWDEA